MFVLFDKYFRNKLVLLDVNPDYSVLRVNALPVGFFFYFHLKLESKFGDDPLVFNKDYTFV